MLQACVSLSELLNDRFYLPPAEFSGRCPIPATCSCRHRRKQARRANYAASQATSAPPPSEPEQLATHPAAFLDGGGDLSGEVPEPSESEDGSVATSTASSGEEEGEDEAGSSHALVSIITADFAMQNVILQMGLQLVSPDGRQIRRISRWVLRCSACFKVTKVGIEIFCTVSCMTRSKLSGAILTWSYRIAGGCNGLSVPNSLSTNRFISFAACNSPSIQWGKRRTRMVYQREGTCC